MKHTVDVAIIGASVGGATAALHLARAGYSVLLCDKAAFPRKKACGEGLSHIALNELLAIGIDVQKEGAPSVPYYGFSFFEKSRRETLRLSEEPSKPHGIGIGRFYLDELLIQNARAAGADVILGVAPQVNHHENFVEIMLCDKSYRCRSLILATGAYSRFPRELRIPEERQKKERLAVRIEAHVSTSNLEGLLPVVIENDFQAVCTPIAPDALTIGLMATAHGETNINATGLVNIIKRIEDVLGCKLEISGETHGAPSIGSVRRPAVYKNIFCIGDASSQLDPIGGMGMTQAILTARVTAETIARSFRCQDFSERVMAKNHIQNICNVVRPLKGYTLLSYMSLSNALGRETLGRIKTSFLAKQTMSAQSDRILPLSRALLSVAGRLS